MRSPGSAWNPCSSTWESPRSTWTSLTSAILAILAGATPLFSYRQLNFANTDVCSSEGNTKTINTGEGALILSLTNSTHFDFGSKKICNILIKAKPGDGLMVHAEQFRLRTNSDVKGDCHDYIEFGREDNIPLWTSERSGKLCGVRRDVNYEDPDGQLLIWLELGPARPPGPPLLSLVITPYKKEPQLRGSGFCECSGPWQGHGRLLQAEQWIRCQYFCDGRVNCALDSLPADEADISCQEKETAPPPRTGGGLISSGTIREEEDSRGRKVNLRRKEEAAISELSIGTIIVLALLGLSLIACGILCTLKRCGPPAQGPSVVDNPNCPEQALSMVELVQLPTQTEENIYCPGPFQVTTTILPPSVSPSQEAPPPSYHDIFPPDYVPPHLQQTEAPENQGINQSQETSSEASNA